MTETPREKAVRLLTESRLRVQMVDGDRVAATCQGDHGDYTLGYDPDARRWFCTCPAPRDACSHLIALRLIVPAVVEQVA